MSFNFLIDLDLIMIDLEKKKNERKKERDFSKVFVYANLYDT